MVGAPNPLFRRDTQSLRVALVTQDRDLSTGVLKHLPSHFEVDQATDTSQFGPDVDAVLLDARMEIPHDVAVPVVLLVPEGSDDAVRRAATAGHPTVPLYVGRMHDALGASIDQSIRQARRLVDLQARLRSWSDRQRAFAHELQTPLTSITGFAELLKSAEDQLDSEQRRTALESIIRNARRASRMVEDQGASGSRPRLRVVELYELVEGTLRDLGDRADDVELTGESPVRVTADPDHVVEAVVNLVDNALKYGRPPVVVSVQAEGQMGRIRVADGGRGVPEDFVPQLFDLYSRDDSVRDRPGSGIGLALTRRLMEDAGGSVTYGRSREGGAAFTLRLPAHSAGLSDADLDQAPSGRGLPTRARIVSLRLRTGHPASAEARLALGSGRRSAVGDADDADTLSATASATMQALERLCDGAVRLGIEAVERTRFGDAEAVTVTVLLDPGNQEAPLPDRLERLVGTALIRSDGSERAAMRAALDGVNRRVERYLSPEP